MEKLDIKLQIRDEVENMMKDHQEFWDSIRDKCIKDLSSTELMTLVKLYNTSLDKVKAKYLSSLD